MQQAFPAAVLLVAQQQFQRQERFIVGLGYIFHVGMRAGIDLRARGAMQAGIEVGLGMILAEQRLGQFQREGAFSDARRPREQKAARQPSPRHRSAELLDDLALSDKSVPSRLR